MTTLTILGPQRLVPTLAEEADLLGVDGPVALITAGWQEREGEAEEMRQHLGRPLVDLRLHRRCEEVFDEDHELFAAYRERQDELRALQALYRYRLDFALTPARSLLAREDDGSRWLAIEREAAVAAVRVLDQEHLARIVEVHRVFDERWQPHQRPAVVRQREAIAELLSRTSAVAIAGGHVAVLLNRMRLFDVLSLTGELPIIAWSAGAMVLAEKIVLFHDSPPQGAGNAEILESGLGLVRGILPLPHARRRLRLADRQRITLLARRFAPARGVPLDENARLHRAGGHWHPGADLTWLGPNGDLVSFTGSSPEAS